MVPHEAAAAVPDELADADAEAAELLGAPVLEAAGLEELDEQAARPRPAARARAAMPPGCTGLMYVSFDTVVASYERPGAGTGAVLPRAAGDGCGRRNSPHPFWMVNGHFRCRPQTGGAVNSPGSGSLNDSLATSSFIGFAVPHWSCTASSCMS